MSTVTERLAFEFRILAVNDLIENGERSTFDAQRQLIESWLEVYEDVAPRNRAEIAVRDALVIARDQIIELNKQLTAPPV